MWWWKQRLSDATTSQGMWAASKALLKDLK